VSPIKAAVVVVVDHERPDPHGLFGHGLKGIALVTAAGDLVTD